MNFFMIYFHRFYRLAPNVAILMAFAVAFFPFVGSGPLWPIYDYFWVQDCKKYFWTFITFINSVYPKNQANCMAWLWYLSHDMIFFVFLPFQIFAYIHKRMVGYLLVTLILLANIGLVFFLVMHNNIGMSMIADPNYSPIIYFKPW